MASYKLNFQNWQHWKWLIPRGPFKFLFLQIRKMYAEIPYFKLIFSHQNLFSCV